MACSSKKYNILVLGGLGFIGKNFVRFIVDNNFAAKMRVVDKVVPEMAVYSSKNYVDLKKYNIEFIQANLMNPESIVRVFQCDDAFDFVFNLAGETKRGQSNEIYEESIVKVSVNCATEAARIGAKFIEISAGEMLSKENRAIKETVDPDPWTAIAKHKYKVEEKLKEIPGLDYIIIRPAIIYGSGDLHNLTPRLIIASIYHYLGQKMKVLWTKDIKMHTVHVSDVCRAMYYLACNGQSGEIYNVVDKNDTDQGKLLQLAQDIFGLEYEFVGISQNLMSKNDLHSLMDEMNEEHTKHWNTMCASDSISDSPLSPFLYWEQLDKKNLNLNGTKLENMGFHYVVPTIVSRDIQIMIKEDFVLREKPLFPPSCIS